VTLIHNVCLTTDYVMLIHDDDCVAGLELLEHRQPLLERLLKLPEGALGYLSGVFGVSGICNVLGAIRLARHLNLGPRDNVVTIATDGMDRYPSVLENLAQRRGPLDEHGLSRFSVVVRKSSTFVRREQKERLFRAKEEVWTKFHYAQAYPERHEVADFLGC